jgi:REP element-mobilizing transposase RayT
MTGNIFKNRRKSYLEEGEIFFWTATINKWQRLLEGDVYKDIIIHSLEYLSDANKIDVYAFVIMPNHIHLIWKINEPNGKESSQGSFLKYTAHEFKKMLKRDSNGCLSLYSVNAFNKDYEFWQRDSLAVHLYTKNVACQKLDYLHNNPVAEHWQLVKDPCDYKYSTAAFYEREENTYAFVKDLREVFS